MVESRYDVDADEFLYHVHADDRVIGPVRRERAHKDSLLHRSGMVFLENKGRLYITMRADKPTFPQCYDASAAFHVTYGETYLAAARREFQEELGLTGRLRYLDKFLHNNPPEHEIVAVFLARSDQQPTLDPREATSGWWHSPEEVERLIAQERVTPGCGTASQSTGNSRIHTADRHNATIS